LIIAVNKDGFYEIVSCEELQWNDDDGADTLTLKEIGNQLETMGYKPAFVWRNIGYSGYIWQYNSDIGHWIIHGKTVSYSEFISSYE